VIEISVNGKWFVITGRMMKAATVSHWKHWRPDTWQYWAWMLAQKGF
jgi:hypothetical protein